MDLVPQISSLLRGKALALGPRGERWLRELDTTVSSLAREWELQLGRPLHGGTESYVVEAGADAVLKVELNEAGFDARVAVLEAADGRGYVRLLRHDRSRRALLLERLAPPREEPTYDVLCAALERAWQVRCGFPLDTAVEKAQSLARFIERTWRKLNEPCPRALVDRSLACCESRAAAFDPGTAVIVHGDAHAANLLQRSGGEPAFVDPEPFRCEGAYDLAVALRMTSDARAEPLLTDAGREWRQIERVSTGLLALDAGAPELARVLLA